MVANGRPNRLRLYVALLAIAAAAVVFSSVRGGVTPANELSYWYLAFLLGGLATAEALRIRFRRGGYIDSVTLFESVLAPVIFSYDPVAVVLSVGLAQVGVAVYQRQAPIQGAFNTAQWMLAAAVGSLVVGSLIEKSGTDVRSLFALTVGMAAVAVVNNLAVTIVMAITENQGLPTAARGLLPALVSASAGWLINVLFGLLFVMATAGHPLAVVLVPVPLVLMHLAYRGYSAARADGRRLEGLRVAAQSLSEPLHPLDAIAPYLQAVRESFEAREAVLVLREDPPIVYRSSSVEPLSVRSVGADKVRDLERLVLELDQPQRIRAVGSGALNAALVAGGWRECVSAPLLDEDVRLGTLIVFDQAGFEGTASSELAVLEALARETAHTLARGHLLEEVMEQERRLDRILSSTSDGIFTLGDDGRLLTWNAACETITGYRAATVLGRRDLMRSLEARTAAGRPVDLDAWITMASVPRELVVTTAHGDHRRLSCSATATVDPDGSRSLVVIARDITPAEEYQELKEQFGHLVEAQAAQRLVVDHLQQAVAPEPPGIEGADIAVAYVASDPSSPTGGDLFDWHELPSGELHVAVVDVLGHGVSATKDALTVVHTLRFAAIDGTPLEEIVTRADRLLSAQDTDLVATVVVARYDPDTGRLRVASGGHPPALIVKPDGQVAQASATGGAIGWPAVGSDVVATLELEVNDSVVFYTDGLIESRKDIIEGLDDLARIAAEVAHLPVQQFADELVRRTLLGADRRDDTLALVLRRTRRAVVPDHRRWRISPDEPVSLRQVRRDLHSWLSAHHVEQDDGVLVAAELLANGAAAARERLILNARLDGGTLVLEVEDDGPGEPELDRIGFRLPDHDAEGGRGMYLVRALSQDVSTLSTTEGTLVRATLSVGGRAGAAVRVSGGSART